MSGVVGWLAYRGGDSPAPPSAPNARADAARARDASRVVAESAAADGIDAADAATRAVANERTMAPDLSRPEQGPAAGRAMLRGRLVDADGVARVGVEVAADVWGTAFDDVAVGGVEGGRTMAESDGEGRFEVPVARGAEGSLSLPASELVFAEDVRFRGGGSDQDLGDLLVLRAGALSGVVQDADGRPVAGVRVEAHLGVLGIASMSASTTTDDGTFSVGKLRPGKWTLRTASSRFQPTVLELELGKEEQRGELVLVVHEGLTIVGRVVDDRGVGVEGMKVTSQRAERFGAIDLQRFSDDEAAVTDAQGSFRLAGLAGEKVTVRAYGAGHSSVTEPDVAVGTSGLELRVQRLASIRGKLVTTAGEPIAGSVVSWSAAQGRNAAFELAGEFVDLDFATANGAAKTDAQGRFVLEGVRPGVVTVRARGEAHVRTQLDGVRVLPAQQVEGIVLRAEVGAVARVEVVDARGAPIEGAKVRIERAPRGAAAGMQFDVRVRASDEGGVVLPGGRALGSGETDAEGRATIMGLAAGDAVVKVTHADYAASAPQPLVLPSIGEIGSRVTLRDPGFLEVTVVRADGGVAAATNVALQVAGAPDGAFVESGKTDAEGRYRFGPLAAGDYTALLSRGHSQHGIDGMQIVVGSEQDVIRSSARDVTIRSGATTAVELAFPLMTQLTGRVLGVDGPVAGCIVELDDGVAAAGFGGRQQRTKDDGSFVFGDVESGDYRLLYGKAGQLVKAEVALTVPPNTPSLDRELMLRTGEVRVTVLSEDDGEPVEDAEVRLVRGGADGAPREEQRVVMMAITTTGESDGGASMMTIGDQRVLTDEEGVAVFEDVPVGDYTLTVEHRRFARARQPDVAVVERAQTDCGTLTMSGAGQIRGVVNGPDGKRVAMAMVEYRVAGDAQWGEQEMAMQGAFRLTGLRPGAYELRARRVGADEGRPGETFEVEVKAHQTAVQDLVTAD